MRPLYGDAADIQARAERAEQLARHAVKIEWPLRTTFSPVYVMNENVARSRLKHGTHNLVFVRRV